MDRDPSWDWISIPRGGSVKFRIWKGSMISFFFLFLLFSLIQFFNFYILKIPFFVSSLIATILIYPLVYLILKSITIPIKNLVKLCHQIGSKNLGKQFFEDSGEELETLSKVVGRLFIQLQKRLRIFHER